MICTKERKGIYYSGLAVMGSHGWVGRWVYGWVFDTGGGQWVFGWVEWVGEMGWGNG